jgi:hypothetical protein
MTPETIGCIVVQGGLPCTLYNAACSLRGGVLLPRRDKEPVVFFPSLRDARRAISRTQRISRALEGSLVDDWLRLSPMLSGKSYEIIPAVRSHVTAKKEGSEARP